jgi:tellurite resistance protein TerC
VFADIAFAIDSIPAAFAITRDPLLIWMGNVFALLGLRALFVLVESLIVRFRYLDETIAVVLGLVGVKLLIEDLVKIGPVASLAGIAVAFVIGIGLSIRADRRDPNSELRREERVEALHESSGLVDGAPAEQAGEAEQTGAGHDVDGREEPSAEALPDRGDEH